MIYVVAQQHPSLPEISMLVAESVAVAQAYQSAGWSILEIDPAPAVTLTDADIRREFAKLYPSDVGILELSENNPEYRLEAIGARHHWAAFLSGARAIEKALKGQTK
jgi:hypothetical protein